MELENKIFYDFVLKIFIAFGVISIFVYIGLLFHAGVIDIGTLNVTEDYHGKMPFVYKNGGVISLIVLCIFTLISVFYGLKCKCTSYFVFSAGRQEYRQKYISSLSKEKFKTKSRVMFGFALLIGLTIISTLDGVVLYIQQSPVFELLNIKGAGLLFYSSFYILSINCLALAIFSIFMGLIELTFFYKRFQKFAGRE